VAQTPPQIPEKEGEGREKKRREVEGGKEKEHPLCC